jgi:cyclic pyranopterin phosphate synthase
MQDPYGRRIKSLRLSLTQRCNLDCFYCHKEGQEDGPDVEMGLDEIARLSSLFGAAGIGKVKVTGGEPLLRDDLADIVQALSEDMKEVSLTTNGTLLVDRARELRDAGLSRVNVSLDTLKPDVFQRITRHDMLASAIEGIEAAVDAGLAPVKLNMVLLKGINEGEVEDMVGFSAGARTVLQLIELGTDRGGVEREPWKSSHLDADGFERELAARAVETVERDLHRRRKYYIEANGGDRAEVEVVRSMHNTEFCANCTRIRVTSDGRLKPCLLRNDNLVDVLGFLREGSGDGEIMDLMDRAVSRREPYWR